MKKVLIILKHLSWGGAEKMFLRLLDQNIFSDCKLSIKLVFNDVKLAIPESENVEISSFFPEKTESIKTYIRNFSTKQYNQLIPDLYDIEIAFLEGYPTKIISCSPNKKSTKIAWIHTDFRYMHHSLNAYNNFFDEIDAYESFDYLYFVSQTAQIGFHTIYPNINKLYKIYYPPISQNMIAFSKDFQELLCPTPYFITLTRFAPEKGVLKLINAIEIIKNQLINAHFLILGNGPLYKNIQAEIHEKQLDKYITIREYKINPYSYIKNSMAYICPSDTESFCIAVEEALFLNVPVIACRNTGIEEILSNGKYGLIVNNDSKGLADGVISFLSNETLRNELISKSIHGMQYWQSILSEPTNLLPNTGV